jgi:Lipocalin-like domain
MAEGSAVGRWRLISYIARADDGSENYPLGRNPRGSLVYTAGGWVTTQLCATDRPELPSDDVWGGSESDCAAAYSSYFAYCGTYEVSSNDTIVHRVALSLVPNWVASEQVRHFELSGEEL